MWNWCFAFIILPLWWYRGQEVYRSFSPKRHPANRHPGMCKSMWRHWTERHMCVSWCRNPQWAWLEYSVWSWVSAISWRSWWSRAWHSITTAVNTWKFGIWFLLYGARWCSLATDSVNEICYNNQHCLHSHKASRELQWSRNVEELSDGACGTRMPRQQLHHLRSYGIRKNVHCWLHMQD